jgi:FMN phosphatase YigB (HAD superfamily)
MTIRCVVLDFDGTFTDVNTEAGPFVDAYRDAVGDLVGADVAAAWTRLGAEVDAHPDRYGWENGDAIVAPGNADPYVRSTTIAQGILDERGLLRHKELRAAITSAIYKVAYQKTVTAFRPDARETLARLAASGLPVYIVTNATTDMVERKLAELAPAGRDRLRIVGDAGKYVVCAPRRADARWASVPAELRLPGLSRAVAPRRGRYYDALARIFDETGAGPAETLVCGDIFELDHGLPVTLGMPIHLVTGPHTPPWELAFVDGLGARASRGPRVGDVLARIQGA